MKNKYLDLKELEEVKLYYESALKEIDTKLNIINEELNVLKNNPINHIKTRIKSTSSIIDKLERKNLDINVENTFKLIDIVGARIVCNFIDDIYDIVNKIKEDKEINILEERDYIKNPKNSGYRGYHIIITVPITINGTKKDIYVEIQIKTNAMDFFASNEHKLNYKKKGLSTHNKDKLIKIANYIWQIDVIMNDMNKKSSIKEDINIKVIDREININTLKEVINWRKKYEVYE